MTFIFTRKLFAADLYESCLSSSKLGIAVAGYLIYFSVLLKGVALLRMCVAMCDLVLLWLWTLEWHFPGMWGLVVWWRDSGVELVWNLMAHAQKPYFFFRRNGRVRLNRRGSQFSRLLAAEVCASALVMLDTPCSEVVWRVRATHSICEFPLHFSSLASPCAIRFKTSCTNYVSFMPLLYEYSLPNSTEL